MTSLCVNWAFFGTSFTRVLKAQFTHERVKYNVFFCSTKPLKAPNRLKPLKLA
jgi:hypothetical protein